MTQYPKTYPGGVGILPTDTLYGLVGSALDPQAVRRIYRLRKRNLRKPMIILIGSMKDVLTFGIRPSGQIKKTLTTVWPGKVSAVLALPRRGKFLRKFNYLHRGTGTLAFRMPKPKRLRSLLEKTGPLVAPSANLEGKPPAKTIREAKNYFGSDVDFYFDAGRLDAKPSTLISIDNGKITLLRKGAAKV